MGFSVSNPTYMYQSPSGYIFRLCIPCDLRSLVGKTEFRYSLRSGVLRVAKHRARSIASYIQQLFMKVRSNMTEFTKEQINQMVLDYIEQTLADDEICRAQSLHTIGDLYTSGGSGMGQKEAESLDAVVKMWLKNQDHEFLHPVANQLLKKYGQDIEPESASYKALSRELMVAFQSILNVRIRRSQGDYTQSDEELIPRLKQELKPVADTPVLSKKFNGLTFTEVQEKYIAEVKIAEGWTQKTEDENRSIYALFVQAMGDLPVEQIDRTLMADYKSSVLMCIPPNMNKKKEYKGLTLKEIIATKPELNISVNTINKYIRRMSSMFNYAVSNGHMASNPAADMQIKNKKRADQEREAYAKEDLVKLFKSKEYTERTHSQPYGFWTPLIALYTGCRLEEICQLHLEDIRQDHGVWVFDINDKEEKKLKNRSSERLVPIHLELINLGLLEFADVLRKKGNLRLFPELKQQRDGYGQTVSKWFGRYKKRCGIGEGKTFHSFRHTFITHLKHKQVDGVMIHELDGHTVEGETMGRYGKRFPADILFKEGIEKIDYEIDLSHLRWKP